MLQDLYLYEYTLEFIRPQRVHHLLLSDRKGLILLAGNHQLQAEAAPLPGYSSENLDQVKTELTSFDLSAFNTKDPYPCLQASSLSSSTKFALFSLCLPQSKKTTNHLSSISRSYIDIPSTHPNWKNEVLAKIKSSLQRKNPYIKIKMSSYAFEECFEILRLIRKFFIRDIQLHLDFNQNLSYDQAAELLRKSSKKDFFLIEDPVKDLKDLYSLSSKYGFPIALDQTLRDHDWKDLKIFNNLKCLIIKPTLSMNLLLDKEFLSFIKSSNLSVDLSSSYESPIGINCIKKIGSFFFERFSLGIDTLSLFKKSCLDPLEIHTTLLQKL